MNRWFSTAAWHAVHQRLFYNLYSYTTVPADYIEQAILIAQLFFDLLIKNKAFPSCKMMSFLSGSKQG